MFCGNDSEGSLGTVQEPGCFRKVVQSIQNILGKQEWTVLLDYVVELIILTRKPGAFIHIRNNVGISGAKDIWICINI